MMKKNHWFFKTLFSYLPIFFAVISVLFLVFFFAFSEYIRKSTVKTNEIYSEQINQAVDNLLQPVEKVMIREIMVDDTIRRFFNEQQNKSYTFYQAHQMLNTLIANFPIIDSVYIIRLNDGMIVSDSSYTSLNVFEDKEFVLEQIEHQNVTSWGGKRIYKDSNKLKDMEVVTLVRKVPFLTGTKGLFVINVKVDSIRELVVNMSSLKVSFIQLIDSKGNLIYNTGNFEGDNIHDSDRELTRIHSKYTGWELRSGIKQKYIFDFFSTFPYVWAGFGGFSIVVGFLLIVYVTRRNYKPIESLIDVINGVFVNKNSDLFAKENVDEIRYISLAIDHLVDQASKYQNQFAEDVLRIRRNLFMEVLEGNVNITLAEWKTELVRLGLPEKFDYVMLSILEIDKYRDFCIQYSDRDQYLLKFLINSVVNEIAQDHKVQVWAEWISGSQLGMIYLADQVVGSDLEHHTKLIDQVCTKATSWASENLKFSITVGVGGTTDLIEEIPQLYDDALEAVKYKTILGNSRVIHYSELPTKTRPDIYNHVLLIRFIAQSYRMGEQKWETDFIRFLHEVKVGLFTREDVISMLHFLTYNLDREVMELTEQVQDKWKQSTMPLLTQLLDRFETLEEFEAQSLHILRSMQSEISFLRVNRGNHKLIQKMKIYIDENYSNPNLSLVHLSDEFNLSNRYLSKLFKDEIGEKFIDYILRVRMEQAKRLLSETDEPVQDIALKVGYVHPFSFIRVFKKTVGKTPGDFRK